MTPTSTTPSAYRAGPHWLAFFAAAFTWPLLISGAQVTTHRVGMAVPDWPTTFGINMFLYDMWNTTWGVFIEHRHRLFGAALGVATIALAAWLLVADRRRWIKALGIMALLAVCAQGVLGGLRVLRNSTDLAAVHGSTGQAVFGLLVALCVLTGRDWLTSGPAAAPDAGHLRRRALVTLILVYVQIVAGALVRHYGAGLAVHVVLALAVWSHAAALVAWVLKRRAEVPALVSSARALAVLVMLQIALGVAAWWLLRPLVVPREVTIAQAAVRSGHVVNGALLLGACVVLTLRAYRHLRPAGAPNLEPTSNPSCRLEAVA